MRNIFLAVLLFNAITGFSQNIPSVKIEELTHIIDTSQQPLAINFWATWCAPCIEEIPWLEKQAKLYKDKGVKLILVSLDFAEDFPGKIADFVKKNKYHSQVLWLAETNADIFCPQIDKSWEGNIPATLFVDKSKNYRHFIGRQISESQLKTEFEKLVK